MKKLVLILIAVTMLLGILACGQIKTAKEAQIAYDNAKEGSHRREVISNKWDELSLKEAKAAKTFEEAKAVYNVASFGPQGKEAYDMAFEKMIQFCPSWEDAMALHILAVNYEGRCQSFAAQKLNEFSLKKIQGVKTAKEAKIIFQETPRDSESRRVTQSVYNELSLKEIKKATTLEEVSDLSRHVVYNSPEANKIAEKKLLELLIKEAPRATSFEKAQLIFQMAPENSRTRIIALNKMIDLATTSKQIRVARDFAPSRSAEETRAIKKSLAIYEANE